MNIIILSCLLMCAISDGSLIFNEHTSKIVERKTNSSFTHVAIIFNENGTPYVYEATRPIIKKSTLDQYLKHIDKLHLKGWPVKVHICFPDKTYSCNQILKMKSYADSKIGTKYSIKGYTKGLSNGMHCGEYVSKILILSNKYEFPIPNKMLPKDLWNIPNYKKRKKL